MAGQTGKNVIVALKVEATLNTAPGATDAEVLRFNPSPGFSLGKQLIRSNEVRTDGLSTMARHGSREVTGQYAAEMSVGSHDTIYEALFRSTAVTAVAVTAATASLASITTGTNTIVATTTSTGSGFLQGGIRVGDVFRLSGHLAANNDLNLRVKAVTTHTLTVHGTGVLTADASAETGFTLTVGKKLKNGTTPVRRSFYIDEYLQDIDVSTVFGGVRWTGMQIRGTPNGMAEVTFTGLGMSQTALASGASPYFTSPTEYTSDPLVFADAVISLGGEEITVATGFSMSYQIGASTLPVIGSAVTPDVYDNEARLSGDLTVLQEDLARLTNYTDEDELELHILLQEPEDAPKDYIGIFVPRLKFVANTNQKGGDGAMVESIRWEAGKKAAAAGYDATLLTMITSAT